MKSGRFRIPIIYIIAGTLWIFLGDKGLMWMAKNTNTEVAAAMVGKRIFFIFFTGFLLFLLIDSERRKNRNNEKQYRNLFEGNPNPIWFYDSLTFKFVSVNDAAVKAYGYSRKEFLSMTIMDIRPKEDAEKVKYSYSRMTEDIHESGIWSHIKKDGSSIYVNINSHKTQLNHKDVVMVMASDTTEKFLYEQQLLEMDAVLNSHKVLLAKNYSGMEDTLNSITDSYMTVNNNWIITNANANFYSVTGIKEVVIGKLLLEVFPVHESDTFYQLEKKVMEERVPRRLEEFSFVLSKWIRIAAFPTEDGIAVYFTDITIEKENDLKLKQTLELYDLASKATGDSIYDIDISVRKMKFNEKISDLLALPKEKIQDTVDWWLTLIHPDDLKNVIASRMASVAAKEKNWHSEYRIKVGDGHYKHISDDGYLIFNEEQKPVRIVGAMKDIDLIINSMNEVKRSGDILKRINNPVIIANATGIITWVNAAYSESSGYTEEESLGQKHLERLYSKKNNWLIIQQLQSAISRKEAFSGELINHTKAGREYWVSLNLSPVFNAQGKLECYISVEYDITERKEKETLIGLQNEKLESVSWLNSHQIRKPVASILALTLLLKSSDDEDEKEEMLNMLYRCSTELDEVIQEINGEASGNTSNPDH